MAIVSGPSESGSAVALAGDTGRGAGSADRVPQWPIVRFEHRTEAVRSGIPRVTLEAVLALGGGAGAEGVAVPPSETIMAWARRQWPEWREVI